MADNILYIPELNPVLFFDTTRANLPKYFTKHFDTYMFRERLYFWQSREDYCQIWQTTDIINLQFESTFDPLTVKVINSQGRVMLTFPALIGLPNKFIANAYSFEVAISLASLTTGTYYLQIEAGMAGPTQKILISDKQFVSASLLPNTLILEYYNSRFHKDVIFETGVKFQFRVPGSFGFLEKSRRDEQYRDERYNPALLNSRSAKQWPVFFGDNWGLPDDIVNLIDEIWSCDNVRIDNKAFGIADGAKMEFITVDKYPKRGVSLKVEEGINRNSRIFAVNTDTTKKLVTTIIVDAKVFGDTGNQGSSNTVPVINVE